MNEIRAFLWTAFIAITASAISDIEDLQAESDYRSIKLRWRYRSGVDGFKVTLCETASWKMKYPCKQRNLILNTPKKDSHDYVRRTTSNGDYEASIYELRMLTNYSVSVQPIASRNDEDEAKNRALEAEVVSNVITISTKGFSARTTRCLGNITDIEVTTGPYFPGKIEVEDRFDKRCVTYGDKKSGRRVYKLTILHDICGSRTNESRIQTSIVVHENRELVTHSSRRFLVVCNFLPGTLTIQAAVQVPRNHSLSTVNSTNSESNYDNAIHSASSNNIRDARLLTQEKTASLRQPNTRKENKVLNQAAVPIILTISALMGIVIFAWKQFYKQKKIGKSSSMNDKLEAVGIDNEQSTAGDAKSEGII